MNVVAFKYLSENNYFKPDNDENPTYDDTWRRVTLWMNQHNKKVLGSDDGSSFGVIYDVDDVREAIFALSLKQHNGV